jgi:hypothetical protein
MTRVLVAAVLYSALVASAAAGQTEFGLDLLPGAASTASGKPATTAPARPAPPEAARCIPALPCGTQLYGAVRKNGAVELQAPVWRW